MKFSSILSVGLLVVSPLAAAWSKEGKSIAILSCLRCAAFANVKTQ